MSVETSGLGFPCFREENDSECLRHPSMNGYDNSTSIKIRRERSRVLGQVVTPLVLTQALLQLNQRYQQPYKVTIARSPWPWASCARMLTPLRFLNTNN